MLHTGYISGVRCPALPEVVHGNYMQATCTTEEQDIDDTCRLNCDHGYVVDGEAVKTCQSDGMWSSPNECVGEI